MKSLIKLIINEVEYIKLIDTPIFNTPTERVNFFESLVEDNLNYEKDNMYYYDSEKFTNENVVIEMIEENVKKKLFYFDTGVKGYDTYSSGVVCSYHEGQGLEMIIERMGDCYSDSKFSLIGIAEENLSLGEVVFSFHAG